MVDQSNIGNLLNVALYAFVVTVVIAGILSFSETFKAYNAKKTAENLKSGLPSFSIFRNLFSDFISFLQNKKCATCPIALSQQNIINENAELKAKISTNYELYAVSEALKDFAKGMAIDVSGNVVIDTKTIEDIRSVGIGLQSILGNVDMKSTNTSTPTFYMIDRLKEKVVRKI